MSVERLGSTAATAQRLTLEQFEASFGTKEGRERLKRSLSTEGGRKQVAEMARNPAMVGACERIFASKGGVDNFSKLMGSQDGIETMRLIYQNPESADIAFRLFKTEGGKKVVGRILATHPRRAIKMLYYQATSSAGTNPPGVPLETTHLGLNQKGVVCDAHDQQIHDRLTDRNPRVRLETAAEFFRRPEKTRRLEQYLDAKPERAFTLGDVWGADKNASLAMLSRICNSDTGFQNIEQFMREHRDEARQMFSGVVPKDKINSAYDLRRHLFETIPKARPPQTDHLQGGRIGSDGLHKMFSARNDKSFEAFAECFSSDEKLKAFRNYLRGNPDSVKTVVGLLTQGEGCVEKTVGAFDSALASEGGARRLAEMITDPYGSRVIASIKRTENGSREISSLFGKPAGREAMGEVIGGERPVHETVAFVARTIWSSLFPEKAKVGEH